MISLRAVRLGKIMTDEELREAAPSLPVLYFDGFGYYRKCNGLLRCVGYTLGVGPQYNLVTNLTGADATNKIIRRILDGEPTFDMKVCGGASLVH